MAPLRTFDYRFNAELKLLVFLKHFSLNNALGSIRMYAQGVVISMGYDVLLSMCFGMLSVRSWGGANKYQSIPRRV